MLIMVTKNGFIHHRVLLKKKTVGGTQEYVTNTDKT